MGGPHASECLAHFARNPQQYDEWIFPDGHSVMILAEGRLLNLGCATGHPSFVMSASFTNQVIAQIELARNRDSYEKKVYVLPKILDEKVARLHLDKLGARLTELSAEQADYIGVDKEGPYIQGKTLRENLFDYGGPEGGSSRGFGPSRRERDLRRSPGIAPTSGLRVNGVGESSGSGSIEITAVPACEVRGKYEPDGGVPQEVDLPPRVVPPRVLVQPPHFAWGEVRVARVG